MADEEQFRMVEQMQQALFPVQNHRMDQLLQMQRPGEQIVVGQVVFGDRGPPDAPPLPPAPAQRLNEQEAAAPADRGDRVQETGVEEQSARDGKIAVTEPVDPILTPLGVEMKGLSCLICYDPFNLEDRIPKLFSCGHTFCLSCVKELFNTRNYFLPSVNCPTCRQNTKYTSTSDPTKVPNNFNLVSMLEQRVEEMKGRDHEKSVCYECTNLFDGIALTMCNDDKCQLELDDSQMDDVDSIKRVKSLLICCSCLEENHARHNFVPFETVVAQYEANKQIIAAERSLVKGLKFADDLLRQIGFCRDEVSEHRRRMVNAIENIRQEADHPFIYDYLNRFREAVKASSDMFKMLSSRLIAFDKQSKARYYRAFGNDSLRPLSRVYVKPDEPVQPKPEPVGNSQRVRREERQAARFPRDELAAELDFQINAVDQLMRREDLLGGMLPAVPPAPDVPADNNPAAPPNRVVNPDAEVAAQIAEAAAVLGAPRIGEAAAIFGAPRNEQANNAPIAGDALGQFNIRGPFPGFIGFGRRRRENQRNMREIQNELQNALVEHPFIGDVPAVRNAIAALEQMREPREFREDMEQLWLPRAFPRRRRAEGRGEPVGLLVPNRQGFQDIENRLNGVMAAVERLERNERRNRPRAANVHDPIQGWVDQVIEQPLEIRFVPPNGDAEQIMREEVDALVLRIQGMVRNEAHAEAVIAGRPVENHIAMPRLVNPEPPAVGADYNDLMPVQVRPFLGQLRILEREWIQRGKDRRTRSSAQPAVVKAKDEVNGQPTAADAPAGQAGPAPPTDQNSDEPITAEVSLRGKQRRHGSPSTEEPSSKKDRRD